MSMSGQHILIIDEVHPVMMEKLDGHHIEYIPDVYLDELEEKLRFCTVLIMRTKLHLTREWIDHAPELKIIGRLGSGLDNIDVDYAESKGIICLNAPEGNRNAVAEQTIGMMLSLLAHIHKGSREVKQRIWDRKGNSGVELSSLTLGIIGYGNVGSELAKRLRGFDCRIMAYDRFRSDFGDDQVEEVELEVLMKHADIVSLHVPLNEYSREMVNTTFVDRMSKPFFLLNLARGTVVDTAAVVDGLKQGKILGAALDVFENERLHELSAEQEELFLYLSDNEKVIFTPHIGGLTSDSFARLAEVLANKINAVLQS